MTSKILFFNLMKEDCKRRLWALTLSFLTFFFTLPVASAVILSESRRSVNWTYPELLGNAHSVLGFENGFLAVYIALLALILGVNSFAWLHNKRKVDFYHSIPVRREKLFLVSFLDGILILIFSYGFNVLLAMIVASVNGIAPGDIAVTALTAFGFFLLHFALLYSVTVFSMMLTGNILVGILGTGVLNLYFPALIAALDSLFHTFFLTSYRDGSDGLASFLMDKCSALTLYVGNYSVMEGMFHGNLILRLLSAFLAAAGLTACSLLLYRLRGSEAAGKAMAFQISRPIIRIPLVILAGISGGLFFWYLHSGMGWAIFGILCGLLLMHCTMEIIYHFDFKKLFSNRLSLAACAAAAFLIFSIFRFDLPGYDSYAPEAGSLKSVALSFDSDPWVTYGSVMADHSGAYYWSAMRQDEYVFSQMQLSDQDRAMALVKAAVEQVKREKESDEGVADYQEGGQYLSFSAKFTRTDGRAVYRSYTVSLPENDYRLFQRIYDSREYRMGAYPVLKQTPEETGKVKVTGNGWTREVTRGYGNGEDYVDRLLSSYQEEFTGLTSAAMKKENPIARLQFVTVNQMKVEQQKGNYPLDWQFREMLDNGYYPIYPSFTKTIALLKECGVNVETEVGGDGIVEADFYLRAIVSKEGGMNLNHEVSSKFAVTEPDELKQLMKTAVLDEYSNMNPFWDLNDRLTFEAVVQGTSGQLRQEYSIQLSEVPGFLKEAAEQYLQEAGRKP